MRKYQVIVGNVGTVCDTDCPIEANTAWGEYRRQSQAGAGRAAHENVTMLKSDKIVREYICQDYTLATSSG